MIELRKEEWHSLIDAKGITYNRIKTYLRLQWLVTPCNNSSKGELGGW